MAHSKEILNLNLGNRAVAPLTYVILNTHHYCGDMGVIVVECNSPMALKDYGYSEDEIAEVGKLEVGDKFTSHDYGNGCVTIRTA